MPTVKYLRVNNYEYEAGKRTIRKPTEVARGSLRRPTYIPIY